MRCEIETANSFHRMCHVMTKSVLQPSTIFRHDGRIVDDAEKLVDSAICVGVNATSIGMKSVYIFFFICFNKVQTLSNDAS